MTSERLQKILARAGLGSRRSCEEMIRSGRVTVNGRSAQIGGNADAAVDVIRIDGERLPSPDPLKYIVLNKPSGVVSSLQGQGERRSVRELVAHSEHLYPVGRLDAESEGLILLTNDGEVALRLTHPRYEHEKEYRVLVDRLPDDRQLEAWRRGVVLGEGEQTLPAAVRVEQSGGRGAWLRVVLREGRKRQIRRTAQVLGLQVRRLIRTRMGPLTLGRLRPGEWRELTKSEIARLRQSTRQGPAGAGARRGRQPARATVRARDDRPRRRQNDRR